MSNDRTRTPLLPIAIFASIVEAVGLVVLPSFSGGMQDIFIWFLVLFPVLVVTLLFATAWMERSAVVHRSHSEEAAGRAAVAIGHGGEMLGAGTPLLSNAPADHDMIGGEAQPAVPQAERIARR